MPSTLDLFRNGAVGFIDWLGDLVASSDSWTTRVWCETRALVFVWLVPNVPKVGATIASPEPLFLPMRNLVWIEGNEIAKDRFASLWVAPDELDVVL